MDMYRSHHVLLSRSCFDSNRSQLGFKLPMGTDQTPSYAELVVFVRGAKRTGASTLALFSAATAACVLRTKNRRGWDPPEAVRTSVLFRRVIAPPHMHTRHPRPDFERKTYQISSEDLLETRPPGCIFTKNALFRLKFH